MLDSRAEAVAFPRGDIALVFCACCGFIFNRAFDPRLTEYSERYEPTQAYSPTFVEFHEALAKRLVSRLALKGKTIIEVGCGQGEFLHLLCRQGGNRGLGFDPSVDERREDVVRERADHVRLVADFFSDQSIGALEADFLCSKMTLEHIPAVDRFVAIIEQVARQSAPGMHLFLQIPESERILTEPAFWDIYYEHCNYFTEGVLRSLFARHGFAVEEVTHEYDGQYLALLGQFTGKPYEYDGGPALARTRSLVLPFATAFAEEVEKWRRIVAARAARGGRVVIWGSGSKGVSFLSALGDGGDISAVVDINPHRQGKFMAGSGHLIVSPADLRALKPATVIIMNRVYQREITGMLGSLGLSPEIFAL
jgi:SAM-dependent methyltransferase